MEVPLKYRKKKPSWARVIHRRFYGRFEIQAESRWRGQKNRDKQSRMGCLEGREKGEKL